MGLERLACNGLVHSFYFACRFGHISRLCSSLEWAGENSSNIASWVQAFGSIAAILGAAHIANRQQRMQIAAETRRQEHTASHRMEVLKASLLGLRRTCDYMAERIDTDMADGTIPNFKKMYKSGASPVLNFPILEIQDPRVTMELMWLQQMAHIAENALDAPKGMRAETFKALTEGCDGVLARLWPEP